MNHAPMSPQKSPWKSRISFAVKTFLVVGLLYYLGQRGFLSAQNIGRALTRWENVVPAFGLLALNILLGTFRWKWLLEAQGIQMNLLRVFQLNMVGNFFNVALPGAVSGDFVKAFYIGREQQGKRARAFGSIMFDRVAGLSGLVFMAAGALLIGYNDFQGTLLIQAIKPFVVTAAALTLAFYLYLFLVREKHDPMMLLFRKLQAFHPKFGSLLRIYESLRHYHNHKITVLKVLAISLVVHMIVGFAFMNFGHALGETQLKLISVYVVMALGLIITTIPVAPAGVGTGHAAFLYLFHLIGSERGADIFTLFVINSLVIGAVGGLFYLRFKSELPMPGSQPEEPGPGHSPLTRSMAP